MLDGVLYIPSALDKPIIDVDGLRSYRLNCIRQQLRESNIVACVLVDPVSLRYAVDFREYAMVQARIPTASLFVPVEGPLVMHGANMKNLNGVHEYRSAHSLNVFDGGFESADHARRFTDSIKGYLKDIGFHESHPRVAIERLNPSVTLALLQAGLDVVDAEIIIEKAQQIKSPEEMACMRYSIGVAEYGMRCMQDALKPGISENELWSILHRVNIEHDGDWIDGRMLCSGVRTNPWYQEASDKIIEAGELVAFDTDMIGPFGYCADISRTWLCEPAKPTPQQRDLYLRAYDEVQYNMELVRPGISFKEISEKAFRQPEEFIPRRYSCLAHGVGMSDQYPKIYYRQDWESRGYDGIIQANSTICLESFVGSERGGEGVKLEDTILVTDSGNELLSTYSFEQNLL